MKLIRSSLVAIVIAAAGYSAFVFAWAPWLCTRRVKRAHAATLHSLKTSPERSVRIARRTLESLRFCRRHCPRNVDVGMIAAVNLRILEDATAAVAEYRRTLTYSRRPEIYLGLGMALAEAGRTAEAQEALVTAVTFAPSMADAISDGALRMRVAAIVAERERSLREREAGRGDR